MQEVFQLYTLNVAEKYGTWPLMVQYLASGRLISFNLPAGTGTNLSNVALTPGCFPEASMYAYFFPSAAIEGPVSRDSVLPYFGEKNVIVNSIKNTKDAKLWHLLYNTNTI